ncbi:16S rRNA (adenine(1518)-N(6)/adenine(1519)-N(6))-dimethyltransferase RsmA [Yunchengibacter salinarum]|uniref:16S rRNA (adenine(1518)-N(6)/adenine(1519)-N(6))- dimethyltransferase RsmA n=1 Tax=Yunchengibacter salinarum TaxID=3133399 RepID=UPI0035B69E88
MTGRPPSAPADPGTSAPGGDGLPPLRDVIRTFDLKARKSLGQNFLLDLNLTAKIARLAGPLEGHTVYEIGPGPGGLTRALLSQGADRVVAVEMDPRCVSALSDVAARYPGRLTVVEGDALKVDEAALLPPDRPVRIAANLPYNVGTRLLVKWLTAPWPPFYKSLTLMFQREVAERLVAQPGSKAYGRLSVLAQWRGTVRLGLGVPPAAFTPPPKVSSAVIVYEPGAPLRDDVSPRSLEKVVATAFLQRRKMLRASLKGLDVPASLLLEKAGIDPTLRAEALDIADFCALGAAYDRLMEG